LKDEFITNNINSRIETLTFGHRKLKDRNVEGWDTKRVPIHVLMPLTDKLDTVLTKAVLMTYTFCYTECEHKDGWLTPDLTMT
jgi:hypothetical protein